ncbi:hypothetical protein EDB92DRAFT_1895971 [Lactarius akahatsu]|uniref:Uncharacterized protein n=1 Tax=Lactarius akahatsu TaxID=416441 RepID=A0AAD4Q3R4_9AGAM|nr:hypothetical protein EDB92DRAFT_1895971 [Lactarius akahatsu]
MTHLPCAIAVAVLCPTLPSPSIPLDLALYTHTHSLSPCCSFFTLTICHSYCTFYLTSSPRILIGLNPFVKTLFWTLIDGT